VLVFNGLLVYRKPLYSDKQLTYYKCQVVTYFVEVSNFFVCNMVF